MILIRPGHLAALFLLFLSPLNAAETAGNHRRGKALFAQRGCAACHAVDGKTASLGPDLSNPEDDKPLTREQLLEAIREPSRKIRKGFESFAVILVSGKVETGRITKESKESITLVQPTQTQELKEQLISRNDIDEIVPQNVSVMPKGLLKDLRDSQVNDLFAYLETVIDPNFEEPPAPTIPAKLPGIIQEPQESDAGFLSPEESMKRIQLAPGYKLELVAAEPMIEEPVLCVWDGNARMYVAEMRTYMQDIDGTDEDLPRSRVSMLEDTNGDGRMDKVSRFVDNLVLPRMILPLDDRIIINETYTEDYYSYRDTDGDGIADEKTLLYGGGKAGGNLEHQNSAMLWGTDNWIYTARTGSQRHRFVGGTWKSERIYGDNGQWGLAMDNVGRLFLSAAGGEKPAYGFQQHPLYGKLELPGDREPNFEAVYPIVKMVDVQGGLGRVDNERGGLNRFTGCAGQSIYRGDRMPQDFQGDYIVPEPVGRLVRRAKVTVMDGKYVLSNAYEDSEFIASTDKNFRPLWSATGPDGCLYIVDMYRGIIQEGNWTREGSYLRDVIIREGLDKNIGRGRIYRVVHETTERETPPKMLEQSSNHLVAQLSHSNGWRRDTAQKLIVLRGDTSVIPQLKQLAATGESALGRMHALWTLDGLKGMDSNAIDGKVIATAVQDVDTKVRVTGIRISEPLLAETPALVQTIGLAGYQSDDATVAVQAINSLRFAKSKAARKHINDIASVYPGSDIVMASSQLSLNYREGGGGPTFTNFSEDMLKKMQKGYQAYTMVCIRCHGPDGNGAISSDGLQLAPPLAKSPRLLGPPDLTARILLHGLTGPIDGRKYPGVMESMKRQDDEWIAAALTFARNSFGNSAPVVNASDVAHVRSATADRTKPYTIEDFAAYQSIPQTTLQTWAYASSGSHPERAVDGDVSTRFDTAGYQTPGQWFQFDMGEEYELTGLTLDTTGSDNDFPRGYEVRFSDDGESWKEPIASGSGSGKITTISLAPGSIGRFVCIIQTGEKQGNYWSIHELTVHGRPMSGPGLEPIIDTADSAPPPGRLLYDASCLQCHGRTGAGRRDSKLQELARPIDKRSNIVRNLDAFIRVGLRGMTSEEQTCPAQSCTETPDAAETAALLSYIRQSFQQGLSAISPKQVQSVIEKLPSKRTPFTKNLLDDFLPIGVNAMSKWQFTASHNAGDTKNAIDGNPSSRYSTGASMKPGMWFAFDMGERVHLRSIVLDSSRSSGDYPRGYAVYVTNDPEHWGEPILTGKGTSAITELPLPEGTSGQHVKIEQTGEFNLYWSIHELSVYGISEEPPVSE